MQDLENQIKTWRMKFPFSVGENRRHYDEETVQMAENYKIKNDVDVHMIEDSFRYGSILPSRVRNSVRSRFLLV